MVRVRGGNFRLRNRLLAQGKIRIRLPPATRLPRQPSGSLFPCRRPYGRSAIAASGPVAAIFKYASEKYASERSPQAPGNPNINHD
jgi:hypothetical protein